MELKYMGIFVVALLLVLPMGFARENEAERGSATDAASVAVAVSAGGTQPGSTGPSPGASFQEVKVELTAEPHSAAVGDNIRAAGVVYYEQDPRMDARPQAKKFKVVLSMTGSDTGRSSGGPVPGVSTEGPRSGVMFAASGNDGWGGDVIGSTARAINSIFGSKNSDREKNEDNGSDANAADDSSSNPRSGASGGGVAAVSSDASSAQQERTDYITLNAGEKASVEAYFTVRNPGTRVVRMRVYEYTGTTCPPGGNPAVGAPCREDYREVASAAAKVEVSGGVPPVPVVNGSTTNTNVASAVISLNSGWNMVSVPVTARVSMQQLVKECGSQDFAWRYTQNGYVKEGALAPGYGYWVKAGNSCSIAVSGDSYTSAIAPLSAGWNLVGALGQEVSLSSYAGNCQVTAGPWYYGPSAATDSQYTLSSTLAPGRAYWIKAASACSLGSPEGVPPAPPA